MPTDPQVVLITGCSTGIGRATAARLARAGHTVYATARRPETLAELESGGCRTLALDVTDETSMQAAVDAVTAEHGAVGALVNNAGYSQSGAVETVSPESLRRQFETNVFGLVRMCQLVLPGMRERGRGRIVNISSIGGKLVFPGRRRLPRHQVLGRGTLSDALRFEVAGFGIGVTIIEPGLIRTEFATTAGGSIPTEDGPYAAFNVARGQDDRVGLREAACWPASAAAPTMSPRRSRRRSPRAGRRSACRSRSAPTC